MNQAYGAAEMSTCVKRAVGAVLVRDKTQISDGFNGPPDKAEHRTEETCVRIGVPSGTQLDKCCCSHAEQNAISTAARLGRSTEGCTLYTTTHPCSWCARALIRAGVVAVVYDQDYQDRDARDVLVASRVRVSRFKPDALPSTC